METSSPRCLRILLVTKPVSPTLTGFSFVLAIAFIPMISGAATTPRWALLAVCIPAALFFVDRQHTTAGHYLGTTFLAWCALTFLWTSAPFDGADLMFRLMLLAGVFVIGASLPDLQPVYLGLGLGFALNAALALAQSLGFDGVPQLIAPSGLFLNKNYLAEPAALVLIGLLGCRMWALALLVSPAVFVPGARGALLALAAAALAWIWPRSRAAAVKVALLLLSGFILFAIFRSHSSIEQRFEIWRDTAANLTLFGHGLGAFYIDFPSFAVHSDVLSERPVHAHNDFLELAYELGIGALLFVAMLGYCLSGPLPTERLILIAFMVEAFFGFPLHLPIPSFLAALAAGRLCGVRATLCDGIAPRRVGLRAGLAQ